MGKTALLEALWVYSGPNHPDLGNRLARFRGVLAQDPGRFMYDLSITLTRNTRLRYRRKELIGSTRAFSI